MASSQLEIAPTSPFGCVLRDSNRRDRYPRDGNGRPTHHSAFRKNLNCLSPTHLRISASPRSPSSSDRNEHFFRHNQNANDLWVHYPQTLTQRKPTPSDSNNANENNTRNNNDVRDRRQLTVVDRPAQHQETIFSIDSEREIVGAQSRSSSFQRQTSPSSQSQCSEKIPSAGGVSSLVQRWRDFAADSKSVVNPNPSPPSTSCASSDADSIVDARSRDSEAGKSSADESLADWESDRVGASRPASSQGRETDVSIADEKETVRVADIIKKLSATNGGVQQGTSMGCDDHQHTVEEPSPRLRAPVDQQPERNCYPVVANSPRIRGRQALNDLLLHMERERQGELDGLNERKPVSRFSNRGRIQSMLRVKILRLGADRREPPLCRNPSMSDKNRAVQGSSIMHLRERFDTGVEHGAAESRNPAREVVNNSTLMEKPTNSQLRESSDPQEDACNEVIVNMMEVKGPSTSKPVKENCIQDNCSPSQPDTQLLNLEVIREEANARIEIDRQGTSHEPQYSGLQEPMDVADERDVIKDAEDHEVVNRQPMGNEDWICEASCPQIDWPEYMCNDQRLTDTGYDRTSDACRLQSDWEKQSNHKQRPEESNTDWINDVSRPRSQWEGLRQERYMEMLDPYLDNGERRRLLERRSVSNFLSSNLRDCIDRLMVSRTQGRAHSVVSHAEVNRHQREQVDEEAEIKEVVEEEVGDNSTDYDVGERESPTGRRFNEVGDFSEKTRLSEIPYSSTPWSQNLDHEGGEDYDRASSPSLPPSLSSYSQDTQQRSSFRNHPSIELELIYDLRGHMEQLRQEMSELRQSINCCIKMQVTMQQSIKEEVTAALIQSSPRRGKGQDRKIPKKGNCSVCYKAKVDSLLYRCGHMCTCFNCANALQWGSGKCPICQAPIMDVVQAYADS